MINPCYDAFGPGTKMDGLATSVFRRRAAFHPPFVFQSMKQRDQRRFFNPQTRGNLGLSQRFVRDGKMQQGAPLGLTQSHRFEPFVQLHAPSPRRSMQERSERILVLLRHKQSLVC